MLFEPIDRRRNILGEGPFWDEESQRLTLVDILGRLVLEYDAGGMETGAWTMPDVVSTAIPRRNGSGFLVTLRDGAYLFDPKTGDLTKLASPDADPGNRSNEARTDPAGRLWLGTMQYSVGPNGEGLPIDRSSGTLSVVNPDGSTKRLVNGIGISNTLCFSPDRRFLYFADTLVGVIFRYRYDADGPALSNREVFSDLKGPGAPDGSAIDEEGFLWNARWGGSAIVRFAPDSSVDRIIDVPVKQPTSCVFGGPERKTLFVTSAAEGLKDRGPASLDGATLRSETSVVGERCVRFAG
jgi:sugar lactone lactonase YvrE